MIFLSSALLALATRQLATLARGERLTGSVVGHHKNKLYVRVPGVVRAGKQGREVPLEAMLTVPWSHALLADPPAALGAELDVYVLRAQVADARLRVTLRPPAEWDEPPVEWARALREKKLRATPPTDARWLDELRAGDALSGTVLRTARCGAFVDVGCWRRGGGGAPRRVDALLPPDQQQAGGAPPRAGAALDVRVLEPLVGSGRLLLTTHDGDAAALARRLADARGAARLRRRRATTRALAVGSQREGVVERVEPYGALVNVGARVRGLVHVTQLGGRGFVDDVGAVVAAGDRVVVEVLKQEPLALRLLKVLGDAPPTAADLAMRRAGELTQRFRRADEAVAEEEAEEEEEEEAPPPQAAAAAAPPVAAEAEAEEYDALGRWVPPEEDDEEEEYEEYEDDDDFDDAYFEDKYG